MKSTRNVSVAAALVAAALIGPGSAMGQSSAPYAGQQERAIKSLPQAEIDELLAGQGMGLAKAAELNGYPGPAHTLEHADALRLTPEQRRATETLMRAHKEKARALGAEVVEAERALDHAFASRQVDAARLSTLTTEVGSKQARLREEHLRTHLEQTALLSAEQTRKYAELRGYASAPASGEKRDGHHGKHH
ncbi:periplasmic heavy metal sensor [Caenimonas sedimenti]|uniref:Periplasmic heavy metal sensor n=1 Tax=Caenimonas sedimenti TaxID=2596921 RepID=A0A562ZN91_9BURK|nr:periplasmic heavy metal sensor [Caenimonas sedimenti]TWO70049.1 periplasmic heavy metal sensor [Caenimonas sedimenti]